MVSSCWLCDTREGLRYGFCPVHRPPQPRTATWLRALAVEIAGGVDPQDAADALRELATDLDKDWGSDKLREDIQRLWLLPEDDDDFDALTAVINELSRLRETSRAADSQ